MNNETIVGRITINVNSLAICEATRGRYEICLLVQFDNLCFIISSSDNVTTAVGASTNNHVSEVETTTDRRINVTSTICGGLTIDTRAYVNLESLLTSC